MQNIVIFDEYNEIDIKPYALLQKYMQLVKDDVAHFLIDQKNLKKIDCPACNSSNKKDAFNKFDLIYQECTDCNSLYTSPRPEEEAINNYYTHSWLDSTVSEYQNRILK